MGCCSSSQVTALDIKPVILDTNPQGILPPCKDLWEPNGCDFPGIVTTKVTHKKSLIKAIKDNDVFAMKELLEAEVDINTRGMWDNTPLIVACSYALSDMAMALLDRSCDVHASNENGASALHYACIEGLTSVCQRLLDSGVDPNLPAVKLYNQHLDTFLTATPLDACCESGWVSIATLLVQRGAVVDAISSGHTALWSACRFSHAGVVRTLLSHSADPKFKTEEGVSCIEAATMGVSNVDILKLLAPNVDVNDTVGAPLWNAVQQEQLEAAQVLLTHGAVVNSASADGRTAMHIACKKANKELIALLAAHSVDLTIKDQGGNTPIDVLKMCASCDSLLPLLQLRNLESSTGSTSEST